MQSLREIRRILDEASLKPQRRHGQNFLIDKNLMGRLVELAALRGDETVLEVGPGTGSLTEELLDRAGRVVAVEIDRGLCELLRRRLGGRENLTLLFGDILAGKHALADEAVEALGERAVVVANLPFNIATPLVALCLEQSWYATCRQGKCRFDSLTFTVQSEVADRIAAKAGSGDYGPISILTALLGRVTLGLAIPATAFWPRPKVASRIVRIDFDPARAKRVADVAILSDVVRLAFGQRRKQIGSIVRRKQPAGGQVAPAALAAALKAVEVVETLRPEQIPAETFAAIANVISRDD